MVHPICIWNITTLRVTTIHVYCSSKKTEMQFYTTTIKNINIFRSCFLLLFVITLVRARYKCKVHTLVMHIILCVHVPTTMRVPCNALRVRGILRVVVLTHVRVTILLRVLLCILYNVKHMYNKLYASAL